MSNPDQISNATIQTASGIMFDIFDPHWVDISLDDIGHALGNICRYGGHARRFYSVAEHSCLMARYFADQGLHDLARAALLHDATEAYMGDLVRPLKLHRALEHYRVIEDNLQRVIFERMGLPPDMPMEIKDADVRICLDERKEIMVPRTWSIDHLEPLGIEINCWEPAMAQDMWRTFYNVLFL